MLEFAIVGSPVREKASLRKREPPGDRRVSTAVGSASREVPDVRRGRPSLAAPTSDARSVAPVRCGSLAHVPTHQSGLRGGPTHPDPSIAAPEAAQDGLDPLADILLMDVGITAATGIPAMQKQHLLESHPTGRTVHVELVSAGGKPAVLVAGHTLECRVPTAPPLTVDLHHRVRRQHPSGLRGGRFHRAAGREGAGRIDPGLDAPHVLVTDDPLVIFRLEGRESLPRGTGPDRRSLGIGLDGQPHGGRGQSLRGIQGDLHRPAAGLQKHALVIVGVNRHGNA